MKKDNAVYLHHILDAIVRIETYIEGVSEADFFQRPMVQDAVARQLEIIGEAARQLPDEMRVRSPKTPWRAIIGMRNRIAHDYLNIDLQIIWEVVTNDLPTLKKQIHALL